MYFQSQWPMELLKVVLEVMKFLFALAETRDDHKQVISGETGNTSEQWDTFLKVATVEHHGRFTEI